jgi:hypothetical protein
MDNASGLRRLDECAVLSRRRSYPVTAPWRRNSLPSFHPVAERPPPVRRNWDEKSPQTVGGLNPILLKELEETGQVPRRAIFLQTSFAMECITGANDQWRHREPFCVVLPTAGVDMPVDNGMKFPAKPLQAGAPDACPK